MSVTERQKPWSRQRGVEFRADPDRATELALHHLVIASGLLYAASDEITCEKVKSLLRATFEPNSPAAAAAQAFVDKWFAAADETNT